MKWKTYGNNGIIMEIKRIIMERRSTYDNHGDEKAEKSIWLYE